jgi:hypothetical protein
VIIKLTTNNRPVVKCRHPQLACARNARLPGGVCTAESERFIYDKTHELAVAINNEMKLHEMEQQPRKLTGLLVERRVRATLARKLLERNSELSVGGGGGGKCLF